MRIGYSASEIAPQLPGPSHSLTLKRASASRPSGTWQDEDYDVFADGKVVGRIYERRRSCDGYGR